MADFDIVIVGGGIAGASLAAEVAAKARVLVIEAETQCGHHSTGRSAAFWLESYGGPVVAQLTTASRAELEAGGWLRRRGALHLAKESWPDIAGRRLDRAELERMIPGVRPDWRFGVEEPGCADIDVAGLHGHYLASARRRGAEIRTDSRLHSARADGIGWWIDLEDATVISGKVLVNAAGAWADDVARRAGIRPLGIEPKRRTMVQLRVGRSGLKDMPLVIDAAGSFYFKGEGDRTLWLSPHDEIATEPCDAAPEEIDVATAIERFESAVDWPVEAVEQRWAGLRSFAPDRVPVYGYDPAAPNFFWCAGQGGFGIQTAPAAAKMAASVLLGEAPEAAVAHIDPFGFAPARLS